MAIIVAIKSKGAHNGCQAGIGRGVRVPATHPRLSTETGWKNLRLPVGRLHGLRVHRRKTRPPRLGVATRDDGRRPVKADAMVPLVPLHGARGTCATLLSGLGYPPRLIADVLGQADVRITETHYSRSDEWQRADALGEVGGLFEIEP